MLVNFLLSFVTSSTFLFTEGRGMKRKARLKRRATLQVLLAARCERLVFKKKHFSFSESDNNMCFRSHL